jgi:hypothetical protein
MTELNREIKYRGCMHPDQGNCSKNLVSSHSIQKGTFLRKISREGTVICYDYIKSLIPPQFFEKGIKSASTFPGFCGYHDAKAFSPIENLDYSQSLEQNFLFAYRALTWGLYMKWKQLEITRVGYLRSNDEWFLKMRRTSEAGYRDLTKIKEIFDNELITLSQNYNMLYTLNLELPYESLLVANSCFSINYDFHQKQINDPSNFLEIPAPLFLNIFPQKGITHIILSCLTADYAKYESILSTISEFKIKELENFFSQLLAIKCLNYYISPEKWDSINQSDREKWVRYSKKNMFKVDPECLNRVPPLNLFEITRARESRIFTTSSIN